MREKISGIYKITSKCKPERCYYGSAEDIKHRWRTHIQRLEIGKHHSPKLQNHFNKYGIDDLVFEIILTCAISELLDREQYFLDNYDHWFNISPKAGSRLGCKASDETRKKMSIMRKNPPEEVRRRLSEMNKGNKTWLGRHHTEETKRKMRESWKTRPPISDETRRKRSLAMIGNKLSLGLKLSEERKRQISEWSRNISDERRHKMSEGQRGRKHSEETKQKMRKSAKERWRKIREKSQQ